MSRSKSIHIGVNVPQHRCGERPLQYSELSAWRMAELASQAGYDSLQVMRGAAATWQAVHQALTSAAGALCAGDTLLVTFSGHGVQERDVQRVMGDVVRDERDGMDETWCLADRVMHDDALAGYWALFERGVRIVVVAESCHSGGCGRKEPDEPPYAGSAEYAADFRHGTPRSRSVDLEAGNPCIAEPPRQDDGIRASVLLLCASAEGETARDGVFTRYLLDLWDDGAFRGSYCDLYRRVRQRVMNETSQQPQIMMLGAADPEFSMATAFHLDPTRGAGRMRGGAVRMAV